MKTVRFALFLASTACLLAQDSNQPKDPAGPPILGGEQVLPVNARTLSAWALQGAEAPAFSGSEFELPPGARLARSFASASVTVLLRTRPDFLNLPKAWPVLEIGPAVLVFMREEEAGRLVLTVDGAGPVVLPFVIPLQSSGKSVEPLEIAFGLEPDAVTVGLGQQKIRHPSALSLPASVEVVASAGNSTAWPIGQMSVVLPAPVAMPEASLSPAAPGSPPAKEGSTGLQKQDAERPGASATGVNAKVVPDPTALKPITAPELLTPRKATSPASFEVFSPRGQ